MKTNGRIDKARYDYHFAVFPSSLALIFSFFWNPTFSAKKKKLPPLVSPDPVY